MAQSRTPVLILAIVIVSASLGGGFYVGYQRGTTDSKNQFDPVINQLNSQVSNLTARNEELRISVPEIEGRTVKIGYIAGETIPLTITNPPTILPAYSNAKPFIEKVIQPNLNAYAQSLGRNVRFEFVLRDAAGQAEKHLEIVQELHKSGVDIFIGGEWSSQADVSLTYVMLNKMLMVSPSSTSPTLAIENDPFYRMCPADNIYQPAMADIIWSYGIRELVVIQRGDSYGDGFMILMKPEFDRLGGKMAGPIIRYPIETANFTEYLKQGEAQALEALNRNGNDTSKVGVLLLALDEASSILKQTSSYRALYDLVWFGGDSTARSQNILHEALLEASHVKLFSPLLPEPATREYEDLGTRFKEATGSDFGIYYAYLYDTAGAIAKTILDTGTDNATKVTAAFPEVCSNSYGASGWLRLNEFGDRSPPTLNIWCYNSEPSTPSENILAGEYNIDTGATVWNTKIRD